MVMSWVKRLSAFLFGGAIVGMLIATWISPTYIAWDSTSAAGQALCNCVDCVKNTTARLISAQLTGAAIGALAMLVLGVVILRAIRPQPAAALGAGDDTPVPAPKPKAEEKTPTPTPGTPPPGSPPPM